MRVVHLSLTNFRNFGRLEVDLPTGPTVLFGANAQGKTNLLESIYYLATTRTPYTNDDSQLHNWTALEGDDPLVVGRIVAQVVTKQATKLIEVRLIREEKSGQFSFRREVLINHQKMRLMDVLGALRVVLFIPSDLNLVVGAPALRRRYIDITLCQTDSVYCRTLSQYNQLLEQRNALLRQLAESPKTSSRDLLPIYSDKLAQLGSFLWGRRSCFLHELGLALQRIHYEWLTNGQETMRLSYFPRLLLSGEVTEKEAQEKANWLHHHSENIPAIQEEFRTLLRRYEKEELQRGMTLIGPHRDDWNLSINGRSLQNYGSRGQQRSAVVALKMAELGWISAESGETPIFLLDDVLAELDQTRRHLLLEKLPEMEQSLLTTTETTIFPASFLSKAYTFNVVAGKIRPQLIVNAE